MGIKRTLVGLVMSAAAALPFSGCPDDADKNILPPVISTPEPAPEPTEPVPPEISFIPAEFKASSDRGDYAVLFVSSSGCRDSYVFDSESGKMRNISNNSKNVLDVAGNFAGEYLISVVQEPTSGSHNDESIKIRNPSNGTVLFQSEYSIFFLHLLSYQEGSKVFWEGFSEKSAGVYSTQVFTYSIEDNELIALFPEANSSFVEKISEDNAIIFLDARDSNGGSTLYLFKTADESLTPITNIPGQSIKNIAKENNIALSTHNAGNGAYILNIIDIPNGIMQSLNVPSGKKFKSIQTLSDDGRGALLTLEDLVSRVEEIVYLDAQANKTELITPSAVSYRRFSGAGISADGIFSAVAESELNKMYIYNFSTKDFYDILSSTFKMCASNLIGFNSNNNAVVFCTDKYYGNHLLLHDTATKTNRLILSDYSQWEEPELPSGEDWFYIMGESGSAPVNTSMLNNYDQWAYPVMTADRNWVITNAHESSSGRYGVLLLNLSDLHEEFIGENNSRLHFLGMSPDLEHVLVACTDASNSSNLGVYSMQSKELILATNNTADSLVWGIDILAHSKNNSKVYFKEKLTDDSKRIKEYCYSTGKLQIISY